MLTDSLRVKADLIGYRHHRSRSHRRGHWFEPSIAHRETRRSDDLRVLCSPCEPFAGRTTAADAALRAHRRGLVSCRRFCLAPRALTSAEAEVGELAARGNAGLGEDVAQV